MIDDTDAEELAELITSGKKIAAIKLLREKKDLSLADAKAQVEQITEQLRASGALPDSAGRTGCAALLLLSLLPPLAALALVLTIQQ